jgi:hypothetical protein
MKLYKGEKVFMKTIYELKNEGLISTHLYVSLIRGIANDDKFAVYKDMIGWKERNSASGINLTVKDIFELWSEEEMLKWRGFGQKALSELKGLI